MGKGLLSIVHDERLDEPTAATPSAKLDELEDENLETGLPSFDDEVPVADTHHDELDVVAARKAASRLRPPTREELEDPLALYARQLADAPVMTPDEERVAAAAIVALDIAVWERLVSDAPVARDVLEVVSPLFEKVPRELVALRRALGGAAGKDTRTARAALARVAGKVAPKLRSLDPDRQLVNAALAAVEREASARSSRTYTRVVEAIRHARRASDTARNEFVRRNLRLVMSIARRYRVRGMPLLDLVQEGNLGLLKAMDRFDPARGFRFSTYAVWWIRHHINRAVADKSRLVRVPVHRLDRHNEIERARKQLQGDLGREPTIEELGKATKMDPAQLERVSALRFERVVSLDAPSGDEDDDRSRHDWFQDPHAGGASPLETLSHASDVKRLKVAMAHLKPIEVTVLRKRFGMGDAEERTLADIGAEHGLSRERIRQIEQQALARLRKVMDAA